MIDFVEQNIDRIAQELTSYQTLQENLQSKKIIALYIGSYNNNFDKYKELAMNNIDFDFYAIFDESLI